MYMFTFDITSQFNYSCGASSPSGSCLFNWVKNAKARYGLEQRDNGKSQSLLRIILDAGDASKKMPKRLGDLVP